MASGLRRSRAARIFSVFLVPLALHITTASALPYNATIPPLAVSGQWIIETTTQRSIFLHGVNIAAKVPPFRAVDTSSAASIAAALDPLQALGYNVARLAFTWEAYESVQGTYNAEYLTYYVTLVRELAKRGIYTLVDFHQDAFSRWSMNGCGEGFPEWTVPESLRATPQNYTDLVDVKEQVCVLWGITLAFQGAFGGGDLDQVFSLMMTPGSDVQKAYMKMVTSVAAALKDEPGVFGFDIINEPFVSSYTFYEAGYAALQAAGWTDPVVIMEPAFKENVFTRPNIKNLVYAPHHYDWRFILDALYSQMHFWIKEGGLTDPVNAFLDNPTPETQARMLQRLNAMKNVSSHTSAQLQSASITDTSVTGLQNAVSSFSDSVSSVHSNSDYIVAHRGEFWAWVLTVLTRFTVQALVDLGNLLFFTPKVGLFDVLKGLLPVLSPFDGDTTMAGFIKDSQTSLSSAPVFLGEFGCDAEAGFMNCPKWVWDMASSVDTHLAAGWTQWAYIPTWDPILKDRFNYEDLSITQGSQGWYAKRPTMMTGRPHVRKVAGVPTAISVSKSPVALSLSYNATSVATGLTEIFFDTGAACGSGNATVTVSRSNALCGFAANANAIVVCDSANVTVGSIVSVKVSC